MKVENIQVYYVNGMMPDENNVKDVRKAIEEIITPSVCFQKPFVHIHKNDSAESVRVIVDIALIALGLGAIGYAATQEARRKGDGFSKGCGLLGLACIIAGLIDYKKIQEDKNAIALDLAGTVSKFLSKDKSKVALLVLHSQGADVGYRALDSLKLKPYAKQIRVVTLGAMTTIPSTMCGRVTNYKFNNDAMSHVVALPFETVRKCIDRQSREVVHLPGEGLIAHGAEVYLQNGLVRKTLREYAGDLKTYL